MLYAHPTEFEDGILLLLHHRFGIGFQVSHRSGDGGIDAEFYGNPPDLLFRDYWSKDIKRWVIQVKTTFARDAASSLLSSIKKENLSSIQTDYYIFITNADLQRGSIERIRDNIVKQFSVCPTIFVWGERKLEMLACLVDSSPFIPSLGLQTIYRPWENWLKELKPFQDIAYGEIPEGNSIEFSWYEVLRRRGRRGTILQRCFDIATLLEVPYDFTRYYDNKHIHHVLLNSQYRSLVEAAIIIQTAVQSSNVYPSYYSESYLLGNLSRQFRQDAKGVNHALKRLYSAIPDNQELVQEQADYFWYPVSTLAAVARNFMPVHDPVPIINKVLDLLDGWIWHYVRRYLYAAYLSHREIDININEPHPELAREFYQSYRLVSVDEWDTLSEFLIRFDESTNSKHYINWRYWHDTSIEYWIDTFVPLGHVRLFDSHHLSIPENYLRCYIRVDESKGIEKDYEILNQIELKIKGNFIAIEFDKLLDLALNWKQGGKIIHHPKATINDLAQNIETLKRTPRQWRAI